MTQDHQRAPASAPMVSYDYKILLKIFTIDTVSLDLLLFNIYS